MNNRVAYGCISTVKIGLKDEEAIKETKIYQETVENLKRMFLPEDIIQIDIITASYRKRRKLDHILEEFGYGDTIIISDLSALGFNKKEIIDNYKKIIEKGIGLLLPDYKVENGVSIYSTTDYTFRPAEFISSVKLEDLCEKISQEKITTRQGRKKNNAPLPQHFSEVYWAFENYFIDERTALSNQYFSVSKRRFYEWCELYEKSEEYPAELEKQHKEFDIGDKPKRYGKVPDNFHVLLAEIEKCQDLEKAYKNLNINFIHPLHFIRINIKFNDGFPNKKLLAQTASIYKKENHTNIVYVEPVKK